MENVGIRALKQNASAVVAAAVNGKTVTITDRGRPVAQLSPLPGRQLDRLQASGRLRAPSRSLTDLSAPSAGDLSTDLLVGRNDERY